MGIREERQREEYDNIKTKYSKLFANLICQKLGLETNETNGLIYFPEVVDAITYTPMELTFDGYKYVTWDEPYIHIAEERSREIKVFDPYSNIKLMRYCLLVYIKYEMGIDIDNEIMMVTISNKRSNSVGDASVKFFTPNSFTDKDGLLKDTNDTHSFYRDSLKLFSLILVMENALEIEYDDLKRMDLPNYEKYNLIKRTEKASR